ncbi:hypothetical protein ONE63_011140 [Megalurothrips usitatus]|uniref:Enspm-3 dr n=1 Tax=Megalurothrips usitatus TaxID=439358 RepID=A0AAV7XLQ0_9NEOP|nr:hypothetical protein ONE63_011140 [Megalurothrips usitatus]
MLCPGCANESFQTVHELSAHVRLFHFDFFKKSFRCKQQNCCNGSVCYSWAGFVRHIKRYAARELPVVNFEEGEVHEEIQDVEDVIVDNEFVDFDEDVDVQDEDRYSIEYFVNNFFKNTEFFAASLYAHPNSSRKLVHSVVQSTSDILTSTITILKQNVFKVLSNCTGDENFPHECAKLNSMFNVLESPFDGMSDFKRLCNLGETGKFIKPEPVLVCHEDKYVNREKTVELIRAPVYEYFIPLRKVLVKFLELPGMFSSITRFMSKLRNRSGISHFLQGGLWQQLSSKDDEQGNKPPTCHFSVDRFLNCSLNLSSSEMLCFTRYLGEMVGDLIPEGNSAWKLYLVLHDILELIMCPVIEPGMDIYMRTLISEHHQTYVNLYGSLKPKHHFMLHYPDLLKRNGPLSSLSALTSERTHRVGKMYAKACNSRIDFPYSVSVKYQLSLCNRLMKYDTVSEKLVKSKFCKLQSLSNFQSFYEFFDVNPMYEVNVANGVYIFETMYKVGMFVVTKVGDLLPTFGEILYIVHDKSFVTFVLKLKTTVHYRSHVCAYIVDDSDDIACVKHNELLYHIPLWCRTSPLDGKKCVSLRHSL